MTSAKGDRLMRLAEDLLCAMCRTRPRVANRQVCRECRRQAEERELAARSRLLTSPGRSNHQQAGASVAATRKARRGACAAEPAPRPLPPARAEGQPRQPPEALNAKSWAAKLSDWAKRCWGANDPTVQDRIGIRDIGGDIIEETGGSVDFVYGGAHGVPQMRVNARSDPDLERMKSAVERMWKMPREGAVITANGYSDIRVLCLECGARVKAPCSDNPSRAASCPNRSRGNR